MALGIGLEPVRELVLRDVDRQVRRERQVGQVVDVHLVVQRQRVVALAPVVADARPCGRRSGCRRRAAQARGDRKPGLAAADHQHGRIAIRVGAASCQSSSQFRRRSRASIGFAGGVDCRCSPRGRAAPATSCERPGAHPPRSGHRRSRNTPLQGPKAVSKLKIASIASVPARVTQRGGVRFCGIREISGRVRASVSPVSPRWRRGRPWFRWSR